MSLLATLLLLLFSWAVGRILSRRLPLFVLRQLNAWVITAVGRWYEIGRASCRERVYSSV